MATDDSNCKACDKKQNNNSLPQREIASYASSNNLTGALGASFGLAVDPGTAGKIGTRLGGKSPDQLMSFIETPGSNKQKRSMSSGQKKKHLINSVGLGNFSLNSTFENGLIDSIAGGREESSGFLKNSKTGSSLIAASALGIDIPNADMLGIGSKDTPMFKLLKLAAFGLKLLCAGLRGTKRGPGGYSSDTEEALGLILMLGINLDLLARLKSIFDKLLGLKPNFSSFGGEDLNIANLLFSLCDWIENMEFGSDTIESQRNKFPSTLTNKGLTEAVGKKLIGDGTYDSFARNDFGFDQQFKSIAGDIDALKCDACNLGKTDITIAQGNKDLVSLEFDSRTGLQRDKGYENPTGPDVITNKISDKTKSPFNQPVTQKEIDEYVPTAKEQSVLKDLSSGEKKSYIKENVRAKKQLEQMKSKRKSSTKPELAWNRPITDAEMSSYLKSLSPKERKAVEDASKDEYGHCMKPILIKSKILVERYRTLHGRTPSFQQIRDELDAEYKCIEAIDAKLEKKQLEVADNLTQPVAAGTDTIQVKDPSKFPEGSYSVLGEGTPNAECICVDGYGSLKLKNPLRNSHPTGSTLSPASAMCELDKGINWNATEGAISYDSINVPTEEDIMENLSASAGIDPSQFAGEADIEEFLNMEKYKQKSISTQVDEIKNKLEPSQISDMVGTSNKTVEEHLGIKKDESVKQIETTLSEVKTQTTPTLKKPTPGISYETGNKSITYTDEDGSIKEDTYEQTENNELKKIKSETKYEKPFGGGPAEEGATEVKNFHTGETITKEELEGTVLEDADLNQVACMHPTDIENCKDVEEVNKTLADAEKKFDEKFETEIEKTENLVLEQQSKGIIFGLQLPQVLNGNQLVINSERVLIQAKTQEVGIYAKRKFFVSTDEELTMNCKQRFVVKSDRHASLEAPTVHLGLYTTRNHPTLKGDCVKWWLDDLCDWLASHCHSDPHFTTSTPVQQGSLAALKARTPTLLSERIFISG